MLRALVPVAALALVLSACGGGGTPTVSAAPATSAAAATAAGAATGSDVTIQGFKFAPQSLEVRPGTKVTWTNKDSTTHTVTSGTPGNKDGKFDGQAQANGDFTFTFAQAGTFSYFCSFHNSMTGTIVVK